MSVSARVQPRSTYLQMTHLLTPYWTPVREGRSRKSSQITLVRIIRHSMERPRRVRPGSPHPATSQDYRSSLDTLHPSLSHWKQRHLMSQCWLSRDSHSLSCHVTFINTNQRGGMKAPRKRDQTISFRTTNLFFSPVLLAELWHLWCVAQSGCSEQLWQQTVDTEWDANRFHTVANTQ